MHASVRRYEIEGVEAVQPFITAIQEQFVERVTNVEGFVGYYVIDGGDGTVTSITVAATEAGVEMSNVAAERWVVERAAHLVVGAPDLTTGEVRVHVER
jgi:hypothetical protein